MTPHPRRPPGKHHIKRTLMVRLLVAARPGLNWPGQSATNT
jgi:hypothetical protein